MNGSVNGLAVGFVVALISYLHDPRSPGWELGFVVTVAMTIALTIGCVVGTTMPLLLRRSAPDPATAATIFLTMVTDSMSFLTFLGLASLLSHWML